MATVIHINLTLTGTYKTYKTDITAATTRYSYHRFHSNTGYITLTEQIADGCLGTPGVTKECENINLICIKMASTKIVELHQKN